MLSVRSLSQSIGSTQLLYDVSCTVRCGEVTALLGPNGAGKTTLLRTVMGLLPAKPTSTGKNMLLYDGLQVDMWSVARRVEAGLVFLPQQASLLCDLSVADNLQLIYAYHPYWQGKTRAQFLLERDRGIERTQLTGHLRAYAGSLSGGQKRKLEIVRSLLMHPRILLLDEPFAGVDPKSIYELKELFSFLAAAGMGLLISDHHVDQLLSIASTVYVMMKGRVVTSGDVAAIMADKQTREQYLGGAFFNEMAKKFLSQDG